MNEASWFLRCLTTLPCQSAIFAKRNNLCDFLFASPDDKTLPEWGLILSESICSYRSKFFFLKDWHPLKIKGQNMKMGELSPLKGYPFISEVLLKPFTVILSITKLPTLSLSWLYRTVVCCCCFWRVLFSDRRDWYSVVFWDCFQLSLSFNSSWKNTEPYTLNPIALRTAKTGEFWPFGVQ